jgi:hypothetical protein
MGKYVYLKYANRKSTYQTVSVRNKEHANEDSDAVASRDLLAQRFNARNAGRFGANERLGAGVLIILRGFQPIALASRAVLRHTPIREHRIGCSRTTAK